MTRKDAKCQKDRRDRIKREKEEDGDKSVERILSACFLQVDLYVKILNFASHSISKSAVFTNTLKPPTMKSSDARIAF